MHRLEARDAAALTSVFLTALAARAYGRALKHAMRSYEIDPDNPNVAANMAIAYHCNGMIVERDSLMLLAIQYGSEYPDWLRSLFKSWEIAPPDSSYSRQ